MDSSRNQNQAVEKGLTKMLELKTKGKTSSFRILRLLVERFILTPNPVNHIKINLSQ
jgi:hypothetical protein